MNTADYFSPDGIPEDDIDIDDVPFDDDDLAGRDEDNEPNKYMKTNITERQLENLNSCIMDYEDPNDKASAIVCEFKISELENVLAHLLNSYTNMPNLLHEFWNQTSDACPLEASEMERQELEWKKFIRLKYFQTEKMQMPDYFPPLSELMKGLDITPKP